MEHLTTAVSAIGDRVDHYDVSSLYETEPIGGPDQDPFLNAVIVVDTSLGPKELLDLLQTIEREHGRQRRVRWGPRTLDLDILASDRISLDDERLTIPHPRASERAFVLVPLTEIWPDAPVAPGVSATDALAAIGPGGVDRLMRDWLPTISRTPARILVATQFILFLVAAAALATDGRLPEGEVTFLGVMGAVLAMSGLVLAFLASRRLGPSISPSPLPSRNARMVMDGPYRYARHPIYGGVVLVLLGTALFLDSLLGVAAALTALVFFWFKTFYEERHLRLRFAGYRRYREVVHRRLIPFLI